MIGAGGALAGRDPATLLVDARGRWQADGALDIAQVGQQLQEAYRARFGDVRQVAAANERVPVAAVSFWEDSLASVGEVLDGMGTMRFAGDKLFLDVAPTGGGEVLTLEVGGSVTSAPGFPEEKFLGGDMRLSPLATIQRIEMALTTLSPAHPEAKHALDRLRAITGVRASDLAPVREAIAGVPRELFGTDKAVVEALAHLDAKAAYDQLLAEDAKDEVQIFSGKESNHSRIRDVALSHDKHV